MSKYYNAQKVSKSGSVVFSNVLCSILLCLAKIIYLVSDFLNELGEIWISEFYLSFNSSNIQQ